MISRKWQLFSSASLPKLLQNTSQFVEQGCCTSNQMCHNKSKSFQRKRRSALVSEKTSGIQGKFISDVPSENFTTLSNSSFDKAVIWKIIAGMRSYIACHIPDKRSRGQIGFDLISPSAASLRDLGTRLHVATNSLQVGHHKKHGQTSFIEMPVPALFCNLCCHGIHTRKWNCLCLAEDTVYASSWYHVVTRSFQPDAPAQLPW